MKRLLGLSLFLAACSVGEVPPGNVGPGPDAPTGGSDAPIGGGAGSLTINATTAQTPAGIYAPTNVVAVWVEDAQGAFVKTIYRASAVRTQHLVAWRQSAPANDPDGLSGATRPTQTPLAVTWNLTNKAGTEVPDGTYTIRMELADTNAVNENENNQGTFTFTKGPTPSNLTGQTSGLFTNVSLNFTP